MITLRRYQEDAKIALRKGWAKGEHRLGISLPTGVGKTVIMASLAQEEQRSRVLILVHRHELVEQTVDKLQRIDRHMSVGVVKASRNQGGAAVVVASVQTVCRPRRLAQLGFFDLVIADEAHRSAADQWTRAFWGLGCTDDEKFRPPDEWQRELPRGFLQARERFIGSGGARTAGFSATWMRSDKRGLGDFWERIVYRLSTAWAIQQGYLVPPTGKAVRIALDLGTVKQIGGDYSEKALGIALTDDTVAAAIVSAYREYATDRQGVLFAPTVASARFFADALTTAGFKTECVFGETPTDERNKIYERSRRGENQIMASCGVLAEGFDAPWLEVGVLARPTLHPGLFIQQVGRVLRPSPETKKDSALILDVVGATELHKLDWWEELRLSNPPQPKMDPDEDEVRESEGFGILKPKTEARILGFEDVSLFGNQRAAWSRTAHGVMYVNCEDKIVFVAPHNDGVHWRVGLCSKRTMAGGEWLQEWFPGSAAAMDWAGHYAIQLSPKTADRKSRRRKDAAHRAPTQAASSYAYQLGVNVEGMSALEVSDAIDYVLASRVLSEVNYPEGALTDG